MNVQVEISSVWHGDAILNEMNEAMMDSSRETAEKIADRARSLVPVKTGKLKSTIRVRPARREKDWPGYFVFAGNRMGGIYWHYMVEYGIYGKRGTPFMRPAVYANFNAALEFAKRAGHRVLLKRRREVARATRLREG